MFHGTENQDVPSESQQAFFFFFFFFFFFWNVVKLLNKTHETMSFDFPSSAPLYCRVTLYYQETLTVDSFSQTAAGSELMCHFSV